MDAAAHLLTIINVNTELGGGPSLLPAPLCFLCSLPCSRLPLLALAGTYSCSLVLGANRRERAHRPQSSVEDYDRERGKHRNRGKRGKKRRTQRRRETAASEQAVHCGVLWLRPFPICSAARKTSTPNTLRSLLALSSASASLGKVPLSSWRGAFTCQFARGGRGR